MKYTLHRRFTAPAAVLAVAGLALAGCAPTVEGPESGPGDYGKADKVVTVYGTIVDTEAELLEKSWAAFEEESGIDIKYEASKEFEAQVGIRAQGGTAPDIAIFPQPGMLADLVTRDYIQPAPAATKANVEKFWSEDWANYGSVDGELYGAPLMASVKGFIWYPVAEFEKNGWEVPKTWDEMIALTKTIREETGKAPWCAGFGSDAATGWPGTDWVEDAVLRQAGEDTYDKWVSNEVKFSDPAIKKAVDSVGEILLNPDYVNAGFGDVKSINTTPFAEPARALGEGKCLLHHQASFYDGFIQDPKNGNATVGPDKEIWAFITPGTEEGANAVTGGGEIVAAFANDTDTQKVQEFLSSDTWANERVKLGGVISANNGLDPASASSPILQEAIKLLQDENTTFRFDASDLMPGVVGSGSFWFGMVDWINGKSVDEVLKTIDDSWPSE